MSDLRDLYQEVIIDHSRHPRNRGKLEGANREAEGYNPLCGDRFTVQLLVADGVVKEIRFEGSGCAIATASASMMTEDLKGRPEEEAEARFRSFRAALTEGGKAGNGEENRDLGKLAVFEGVREFPVRVKCATLAWHTFEAALRGKKDPVTTE